MHEAGLSIKRFVAAPYSQSDEEIPVACVDTLASQIHLIYTLRSPGKRFEPGIHQCYPQAPKTTGSYWPNRNA